MSSKQSIPSTKSSTADTENQRVAARAADIEEALAGQARWVKEQIPDWRNMYETEKALQDAIDVTFEHWAALFLQQNNLNSSPESIQLVVNNLKARVG
jgi:hypothetical protein